MNLTTDTIERCIATAKRFGATKLILFGSALEDPKNAKDIDLACDGIEGWKFFEFGASLEELGFAVPVDVIPLSPSTPFTRYIEKKGRILYEV